MTFNRLRITVTACLLPNPNCRDIGGHCWSRQKKKKKTRTLAAVDKNLQVVNTQVTCHKPHFPSYSVDRQGVVRIHRSSALTATLLFCWYKPSQGRFLPMHWTWHFCCISTRKTRSILTFTHSWFIPLFIYNVILTKQHFNDTASISLILFWLVQIIVAVISNITKKTLNWCAWHWSGKASHWI